MRCVCAILQYRAYHIRHLSHTMYFVTHTTSVLPVLAMECGVAGMMHRLTNMVG